MSKEIRISDLIIPKFRKAFNDTEHTHLIITSGRAGTKSSFGGIRDIYKIISDDNCSTVVMRKFHNKLKKTVYKETLRGIHRLGLNKKRDFKITVSPMEIQYKKNGNTIYFTGNDSIDDTKGMIDESKPIKRVVIDELTEFFDKGDGEDELSNIEATFIRGNDEEFQMVYFFNPPKNPAAPVMKWLEKMKQRPDVLHIHVDYRDVPISWLGKKLIESAEIMKRMDERLYNWVWLGQSIGLDELIYYMFNRALHIKDPPDRPDVIGIGIDYGQMNATTYQPYGVYLHQKKVMGLAEYYHCGREQGQKSPSEYAKDFREFAEQIEKKYHCYVRMAFIDPSAKGLAEEIKRQVPRIKIVDADNTVKTGIGRVQKLMSFQVLSFCPEQKHLAEEMELYGYKPESIEKGKEEPLKENDHCQDATRYCIMGLWKWVRMFLPAADREDDAS